MATSIFGRLSKVRLSIWVSVIPLAICLVFSLFYVISSLGYSLFIFSNRSAVGLSSILSPTLDFAVWGVSIFLILARLGYDLELNVVKGNFRPRIGTSLIVAVCGMAIGVVAVILGFIGALALVVISIVVLIMCVLFSSDFFGVGSLRFLFRLLIASLVVGLLVELAGFLF